MTDIDMDAVRQRFELARAAGTAADHQGWNPYRIRAMVASWQDVAPLFDALNRQPGPAAFEPARVPGTDASRPIADLRDSGLLWLINRVVFHPRGWALALHYEDGAVVGWGLQGNGREVWQMNGDEDEVFARAQRTLQPAPHAHVGPALTAADLAVTPVDPGPLHVMTLPMPPNPPATDDPSYIKPQPRYVVPMAGLPTVDRHNAAEVDGG